jgi:hypothetical protein
MSQEFSQPAASSLWLSMLTYHMADEQLMAAVLRHKSHPIDIISQ